MNKQREIEKAAQNGQRVTKHGVTLIVFQSRLFNGKLLFFSPHDKLGCLFVKSGKTSIGMLPQHLNQSQAGS